MSKTTKRNPYMRGVISELDSLDSMQEATEDEWGIPEHLMSASIRTAAQTGLAQTAATLRLAEAQERTNEILEQLGSLIGLHPVLTHVMATQNMVLERNELIDAQNNEIAQLKVAAAAAGNPEDADGKPN